MLTVLKQRALSVIYEDGDIPAGIEDAPSNSHWPYNIYIKLKNPEYADAFKETNEYVKELSGEERQRLFRFYENCSSIMVQNIPVNDVVKGIREEVIKIDDIIDPERIKAFNNRRMVFDWLELEKVELIKKEELERTTYTNAQANELMCLSVAMKIVTPVFGTLTNIVKSSSGVDWKERKVMEVLKGSTIEQSEAYQRLYVFCQAKGETARSKISSTAKAGLTLEKLQEGVMAIAVVKFLSTFCISGDKNIVTSLFQDTTTYIDMSSQGRFRDKGSVGSSGEQDDGLAQHWRRGQNTRPVDRAVTIGALKNVKRMMQDMKITSYTVKQVNDLAKELCANPNKIALIHIQLMAAAFVVDHRQVINVKMLAIVDDKEVMRKAQALAYFAFKERGYDCLANLIVSRYTVRSPEDMSTRKPCRGLTVEDHEVLVSKYPLVNANVSNRKKHEETPGNKVIEEAVSFILKHNFENGHEFETIRQEMVHLIKEM